MLAGVRDVREAIAEAAAFPDRATVLFIDEVHRFNKAQQDAFLPHVEKGTITFIGATTENPSFEVNAALLSRSRVYVLKPLEAEHIGTLLQRAAERDLGVEVSTEAVEQLVAIADGDARRALNTLEIAEQLAAGCIEAEHVRQAAARAIVGSTKAAMPSTIRSRRCTRRCAAVRRTPRCTGWRGCWTVAAIHSTWRGGWCAWRARMWAWRTRARCN